MSDTPLTDVFLHAEGKGPAALRKHAQQLERELATLRALIAKSSLIEVPATRVDTDGCGKPVIVRDGTMLVHKHAAVREKEETELLRKLAAAARKNEALRKALKMVQTRWTFSDQFHTHAWHDWADCKPVIESALAATEVKPTP